MKNFFLVSMTVTSLVSCCKSPTPITPTDEISSNFESSPTAYPLSPVNPDNNLKEASGLTYSQKQAGMLWSHEDSGSANDIFLLNSTGRVFGTLRLPFSNFDWEDIATAPGPQPNIPYLYLADIGDNGSGLDIKRVYRFVEPNGLDDNVTTFDRIQFRYPDGSYDAETMIVDPLTKDIYIITKWIANAHIYKLVYPQSTTDVIMAEKVGEMTIGTDLTGGAISVDGREIIVRGYSGIHYWQRKTTQSVGEILLTAPQKELPYVIEPQGEAVTFDKDSKGYFTLSERRTASFTSLYYYARK